jgi:hypothetical protein
MIRNPIGSKGVSVPILLLAGSLRSYPMLPNTLELVLSSRIQKQLLESKSGELEAQVKIVLAEAQGSWLQRNWRPMLMVTFAGLVVAHWFGFTAENIPESVQNSLLNIVMVGVGGYVAGRSAEKVVDKWKGPS